MDRRQVRTRKAILEALLEFMPTHELDTLTVSQVAERADINRVTFYAHFKDMDALVDSAAMRVVEEAGRAMADPYVDAAAHAAVEANIREFVNAAERGRPLFRWIGNSSRRGRLHDLVFRAMRDIAFSRAAALGWAGGETAELCLEYVSAGCARVLMDFLMSAEEPGPERKGAFLAILPRLWLPSIYGALGIGEGPLPAPGQPAPVSLEKS
jgi:AcrR family transcriptional regulator